MRRTGPRGRREPAHGVRSVAGDELAVPEQVTGSEHGQDLTGLGGATVPRDVIIDGQEGLLRRLRNEAGGRDWVHCQNGDERFVRDRRYKLYDDGRFCDGDRDPATRHAVRYEDGRLEPADPSATEPGLRWPLDREHLEQVVDDPEPVLAQPGKLDWGWVQAEPGKW